MFETVFCIVITGEDEDAWTLNEVAANWAFEDVESGIKHCEWAIGNFNEWIELSNEAFDPIDVGVFVKKHRVLNV